MIETDSGRTDRAHSGHPRTGEIQDTHEPGSHGDSAGDPAEIRDSHQMASEHPVHCLSWVTLNPPQFPHLSVGCPQIPPKSRWDPQNSFTRLLGVLKPLRQSVSLGCWMSSNRSSSNPSPQTLKCRRLERRDRLRSRPLCIGRGGCGPRRKGLPAIGTCVRLWRSGARLRHIFL
jgi:hypothetical protein